MKDIQLLEKCDKCGEHITLMESIRIGTQRVFLVKRCLKCMSYKNQAEEVVEVLAPIQFMQE